jgi:monothiol glutaredoxin
MPRNVLDQLHVHPAIREIVANHHADIVREGRAVIAANDVVVMGMEQNPFPKKARKALDAGGVPHRYLEYGSCFSEGRRRNALKMWSGRPTIPMVFVKGVPIGGAEDLARLIDSGELKRMMVERTVRS